MHELSLCRSLERIVTRAAGDRVVAVVRVDVGQLRQVVPESLHHCWGLVVRGTPLAGSALEITSIPVVVACDSCGSATTLTATLTFACGTCGSTTTRVAAGEEFLVTSIDLDDTVDAVASGKDGRHGSLPSPR